MLLCAGPDLAIAQVPLPPDFINCIGPYDTRTTCTLPVNTYLIDGSQSYPYATIQRSGITVQGVQNGGSYPTLQRSGSGAPWLMNIKPGISATIQYLNFDGNRYGVPDLNCYGPNGPFWDLNLSGAGTVIVQYVNFMNAPATAAIIDGNYADGNNSVIQYSTWAYGSSSQAARSTGVWLQGIRSEALYNSVFYSGTAGIGLNGYGQWIYGNALYWNRYEEPDNVPGGQIYLDSNSEYAYLGANIVYGAPQDTGQQINGCSTANISPSDGFEVYGTNHFFYDNGVYGQTGTIVNSTLGALGMLIGSPASGIYISQSDPWNPSDTEMEIWDNSTAGVWVRPGSSYITFDGPHIDGNPGYGVYLDTVNTVMFSSDYCMYGNLAGNIHTVNSTNVTYPTTCIRRTLR
jgi:hypothetical protein